MIPERVVKNFEAEYGPVPKVVSWLIRPTLIAAPDHTLVWGDWSSIEARVLPWLSDSEGGERVLDVFRTNDLDPSLPDIYKLEAAGIYEKNALDVVGDERQVGKVATLALGFGGGEGALEAMAVGYGIILEPSFRHKIVNQWRTNNEWAVDFWSELSDAFYDAWNNPETLFTAGRVGYMFFPSYLRGSMMCFLPDGGVLTYANLRREKVTYEDDDTAEMITEFKTRYQSGYERKTMWHGILAENITQAVAARLLQGLLRRLRRRQVPVVLHTHDEAGIEVLEAQAGHYKKLLQKEMEFVPDWAEGLPLAADCTANWYYTKTL